MKSNVIAFVSEDKSDEIFEKLRGSKFLALSYNVARDEWTLFANKISAHEAVFGMTKAINEYLDD